MEINSNFKNVNTLNTNTIIYLVKLDYNNFEYCDIIPLKITNIKVKNKIEYAYDFLESYKVNSMRIIIEFFDGDKYYIKELYYNQELKNILNNLSYFGLNNGKAFFKKEDAINYINNWCNTFIKSKLKQINSLHKEITKVKKLSLKYKN